MTVSEFSKQSGYAVFTKGEDREIETGYCVKLGEVEE